MKLPLLFFIFVGVGGWLAGDALAQNPPPVPAPPPQPPQVPSPRRSVNLPPSVGQAQIAPAQFVPQASIPQAGVAAEMPTLKQNYHVRLAVSEGEETVECSVVTASTLLDLKAVAGDRRSALVYLSGSLAETDDGTLVVQYTVGITFTGENNASHQESARGVLRARPGARYPVLSSGKRTYSLTIAPFKEE